MTEGDEKYKLGELTADMAAVKHDVLEIKATQKEIITKLDNMNAVTVERWEKRNAAVDARLQAHNDRLEKLEECQRIERQTSWYKLRQFIDNTVVKVVGSAIFGMVLIAVIYYVQQSNEYAHILQDLQQRTTKN